MKIVFLDAHTTNPGDISFGELAMKFNFTAYDRTEPKDLLSRAEGCEILIINKFKITRDHIKSLPQVKLICVAATGYNNVDVVAAKELGVVVCNVRNYATKSVSQHIFASLLSVLNRSQFYAEEVRLGRWSASPDFCFYDHSINQLDSMTLGVYGLGDIGQEVARIGLSFGMSVIASSRTVKSKNGIEIVSREELFRMSDILTLHVSLNEDTIHCVNKQSLDSMKVNAILINTGRGALIQEDDLSVHLQANEGFTAILDVLTEEPPSKQNPLIQHRNCHISPHIAWASIQARATLICKLYEIISEYQNGRCINVVS